MQMVEQDDEDRISKLPDCLLAEILGRLPDTKYAVSTGTLSTPWKHIWTEVSNLLFLYPCNSHIRPKPEFFSFVDKTLTQRPQFKLKKFKVHTNYNSRFHSQVNNWIHYAINCHVEELILMFWGYFRDSAFPLDEVFFSCSCFTHLTLRVCVFNPIGKISWKSLRSLCISSVKKLNEDLIENMLSGSPVLETLELYTCEGHRRLDITSKSVKKLVLSGYIPGSSNGRKIIEINAPNILSLTIKGRFWLWKFLLRNVSCLVEAELDYIRCRNHDKTDDEAEEEMLKGFILGLRHVKDLRIGASCFEVLARLKTKGLVVD